MYHISGDILDTTLEKLASILHSHKWRVRLKSSTDLFVTSDTIDINIYEFQDGNRGDFDYLISGVIEGECEEVESVLREMGAILEKNSVVYNFEFADESTPSEDHRIRHPEF